jgi:hypothetical protein
MHSHTKGINKVTAKSRWNFTALNTADIEVVSSAWEEDDVDGPSPGLVVRPPIILPYQVTRGGVIHKDHMYLVFLLRAIESYHLPLMSSVIDNSSTQSSNFSLYQFCFSCEPLVDQGKVPRSGGVNW